MPIVGTLDVAPRAAAAPKMEGLATEAMTIPKAEILQLMYEIRADGMDARVPGALHPTIPPTITFVFYKAPSSEIGPFTLAQVRIGCRAGVRPRGYLIRAMIDNADAGRELDARWGFGCDVGPVSLKKFHDRVVGEAGGGTLHVELVDPQATSGGDIQYVASMHLAQTPNGLRLVQVDPEFTFHRAERGRPHIIAFEPATWGDPTAEAVYPVSASYTVADIAMPRIRYISQPDIPALQGTEKVG